MLGDCGQSDASFPIPSVKYRIELKPKAEKDLKGLPKADLARMAERLRWLEEDLRGDVKRLSNHFPEYRMRPGITGRFLRSMASR